MDVEEDTISLGDEEDCPFIYEDFADSEFNEIDEMVLDRYNAVSMNLGAKASLFRQVPSACVLTHTDTLPLHVCYMLALYIVSKYYNLSCRTSSQAYICSHEIHDACCANCKGKMANGSEISGAFWLLDSGASCHFTGDLGDFASYQVLKHKHYAKMANGVAEIAGISTVLLQCLDHNTGDEKVVKLTQVLHMPGASACLISMGKMLLHNYRVDGDKKYPKGSMKGQAHTKSRRNDISRLSSRNERISLPLIQQVNICSNHCYIHQKLLPKLF